MLIGTAVLISLAIPHTIHSDYSKAVQIYINPLESLSNTTDTEGVKQAISYVAKKYFLNESELMKVIECESSYRTTAIGDGGLAYSLLQFHKPTFNQFCSGDYYSAKDQLKCAAEMWSKDENLKRHWSCWRNLFD